MSSIEEIKKDISQIRSQWTKLDSNVKLLDIMTLLSIALFTFSFFYVYFLGTALIVTNVAFMIFPAIISGYLFIFRSKLNDPEADHTAARKEFLLSVSIVTIIIFTSFLYTLMLE